MTPREGDISVVVTRNQVLHEFSRKELCEHFYKLDGQIGIRSDKKNLAEHPVKNTRAV